MEDYSKKSSYGSFGYKPRTPLTTNSNSISGVYNQQSLKPNYRTIYNSTDRIDQTKNSSFAMKSINSFTEFNINKYDGVKKYLNEHLTDTHKNIINLVFWGIFLYFTYIAVCVPCCIVVKAAALHLMFFLLLGKIIWNHLTKSE